MAHAAHSAVSATSEVFQDNGETKGTARRNGRSNGRSNGHRQPYQGRRTPRKQQYYTPVLSNQPTTPVEGVRQAVGVVSDIPIFERLNPVLAN